MNFGTSQGKFRLAYSTHLWAKLNAWVGSGWAALLFFLTATIGFTWPLVTRLGDSLPDWGDPADGAWRIGVIAHQLTTNPLHLYQTRAFYPGNNGIELDELLTGQALLGAPIYWLTNNPVLTYNLLNFASFTLSGWAMWLLVRHLTGSGWAGIIAGLIYSFSPWHYGHYGHIGLSAQQWMILALYALIRFLELTQPARPPLATDNSTPQADNEAIEGLSPKTSSPAHPVEKRWRWRLGGGWPGAAWRWLAFFTFCFALQALVAGYYAYFETILIGLFLLYYFGFEAGLLGWLWKRLRGRDKLPFPVTASWRQVSGIVAALAIAGLIILPFVIPFVQAQQQYSFKRDLKEISYWSAAPPSFLRTVTRSWLYNPVQRGIFGLKTSAERMLYPGLITVLLALVGLGLVRSERHPARRWLFGVVGLVGFVLSFGPVLNLETYGLNSTGISLPYKWLYEYLPGFDALRVPYRFGQLIMLGLAVLAGYGVARLSRSWHGRRMAGMVGPLLLVGLVTADFIAPNVPITATPTGATAPAMYHWLTSKEARTIIRPNDVLLELPISDKPSVVNTSPIYLMYSLAHGRPMLNGSANIIPSGYNRLYNEMQSFPNPATLDIAEGLGVKFLLVHTKGLTADANRAELERQSGLGGRLKLLKEFPALDSDSRYCDRVYRLKSSSARTGNLKRLIPEGSEVLLADQPGVQRLYTAALPGLLGPNHHYFSTYATIYSSQVKPAQPGRVYEYGIFYRENPTQLAQYGYTPSDLIPNDSNDIIQVYHKRVGPTP